MDLPEQMREAMVAHARFAYPEEGCGLLASAPGDDGPSLRMVYCLTNATRSPTRYTVAPNEHFRAMRHAESNGWELTGVFHSHTHSAAYPSPTDVQGALEPDWLYVIVGLSDPGAPDVRAYRIRDGHITEEELVVVDDRREPARTSATTSAVGP